ncbi:13513_t:CDS:2 [Funneliformis mosseae]|uniref:13513_t:CDS:1 n=1 Tax=Funneliformis mosseae TaxID=27381 RepID=A0A9N8YV76_FUNMO|nr:13513_t:CDS:2 [Funneliformis mosseae]
MNIPNKNSPIIQGNPQSNIEQILSVLLYVKIKRVSNIVISVATQCFITECSTIIMNASITHASDDDEFCSSIATLYALIDAKLSHYATSIFI